ncbi:toll/interleukin-1 receptor domain-containing protein [Tistrella sp.]|nr:toll/interleukin-1 receptor domain-containing protein [Tistrella sp.]|tara:strand:+ start:1665 stop:2735 length:1071 start_codon:yes stop_codon:yes gene_type:complete
MRKFTLTSTVIYDADRDSYPFIARFDTIIELLVSHVGLADTTTQKILTDSEIYLTPLYYTETSPPQPYVQMDLCVDREYYIKICGDKSRHADLIKESIRAVMPARPSNKVDVNILTHDLSPPVDDDPWRTIPQYQFGRDIETLAPDVVKGLWGDPEILHVFISHKSDQSRRARNLKHQLLDYGISSFVAHENIAPNTEWEMSVQRTIFSCDALVALVCDNFSPSAWTDQEVGIALGRQIPVHCVRLSTTAKPAGFLEKVQAFPHQGNIVEHLLPHFITDPRTVRPAISSLLSILPYRADGRPVDEVALLLLKAPATAWQTTQKDRFSRLYHRRPVIRKSPQAQLLLDKLGREPAEA